MSDELKDKKAAPDGWVSPQLHPVAVQCNTVIKTAMMQLVTSNEMKKRGSGAEALAGCMGGCMEAAWELSGGADNLREAWHASVDQFFDVVAEPPKPKLDA